MEPEPDGLLETGPEFIEWYKKDLLPTGTKRLASLYSISESEAEQLIKRHIQLCYDVCHFAIGYEQHSIVIKQLAADRIKIGKIQISAALKADMPDDADSRMKVKAAFSGFKASPSPSGRAC